MRSLFHLLALLKPYWLWVLAGILLSLVTMVANIALMATSGWFITAMGLAGVAGAGMNYFSPAALIRACAILRTGGRYLERLVTHEATFRLLAALRRWFYDHLEPLAPGGLEAYHSGDLVARLQGDIDRLQGVITRVVTPILAGGLAAAICLVFVARYDLRLALVLAVLLALAGLGLPLLVWILGREPGRAAVESAAALRVQAIDHVQGMAELLAFSADENHRSHFLAENRRWTKAKTATASLTYLGQAGSGLLANLALWSALVLTLPLTMGGGAGGGAAGGILARPDVVMLALLAMALFETVAPLPAAVLGLTDLVTSARRLFAIADLRSDSARREGLDAPTPDRCPLVLERVRFTYNSGPPILEDFSLTLEPGERLALVGSSGSGKSTLVALLVGLCMPTAGRIILAGRSARDWNPEAQRRLFAVAPQDARLFTGSLRENLTLGHPDAGEEAIARVCRTALLEDVLATLPEGLDTPIGAAGATLSGGQARRVGVARALLKPAPVVLLDEPTEGLDSAMGRELLTRVLADLEGRSLLVITHDAVDGLEFDRVVEIGGRE
ncbi:MAG: thiol reductant ABC exporter subunit CydC [Rhodospirillum sp.]|nr:thiol reductant ABC exporter subunit CydC [Rhodospirillum sp.]MCF8490690.1 thiol reductant ABC exporter subunit CydC [Rhodospirillum sp.]MCF8502341.1 thiol reductant ABC exporter subunit CydC [Rhodospirillum sp.]